MSEHSHSPIEKIYDGILEAVNDNLPKQKSLHLFKEENPVQAQMNKLFGRQKSVHHIFGGGKSADMLLWRNKKISSSGLVGATAVWVLFEWLNYHFLTLVCLGLVIGMVTMFVWSNASSLLNRSPTSVQRLVLPNELFVNIATALGAEINRFLGCIQDVASGNDLKNFIMVVAGLWMVAIIGTWCNFLTVLYIGYVAAHTLPVIYEKYDEQIDSFAYNLLGQFKQQYRKLDEGVLSKIPKGNLTSNKSE